MYIYRVLTISGKIYFSGNVNEIMLASITLNENVSVNLCSTVISEF